MNVSDYRDLMDALSDQLASAGSAANDREFDAEWQRLAKLVNELEAAQCRTAKLKDLARSARLRDKALELRRERFLRRSLTP